MRSSRRFLQRIKNLIFKKVIFVVSLNQISSVTNLAKKIAEKELINGGSVSSEVLEVLNAVAKTLEAKAGGNLQIIELTKQVQAIVSAKVST